MEKRIENLPKSRRKSEITQTNSTDLKTEGFGSVAPERSVFMTITQETLAELAALGINVQGRRAQYIVADACPECGLVPLYAGHTCGDYWGRDVCSACGELLAEYQSEERTQTGSRCNCGACPFCAECCARIGAGVTAQLIPWPLARIL